MYPEIIIIGTTLFGLLVGSFLNVIIYRMPRELSIVSPRSKCQSCNKMLPWYLNIPVLSYLFLKGKCYFCKVSISWRYPLIELLTAMFAFMLAPASLHAGELLRFSFEFSVACVFLCHFLIDIEHQILPDKLNIYLLAISLPFILLSQSWSHWLLGGLIGFFGPYFVTLIFYKIRGVIGLGGGDIKLFGILGFILGPLGVMNNIFMSCMLGSIIGSILIVTKKMDKDSPFAFGPYIIIAATLQIFFPSLVELINPLYIK